MFIYHNLENQDKPSPVLNKNGTQNLIVKCGMVPYFKGRVATVATNAS